MALKDTWRDLINTTNGMDGDDASAEDINKIAHAVIDNEEKIKTLDGKIGDVDLSGKEDNTNKVDYFDESVLSTPYTEEYPTTYAAMSAIVQQALTIENNTDEKLKVKEDVANKISEWQENLSDEQYPSAPLVKNEINIAKAMAEDGISQAAGAYLLADQALTEALAAGDAAETALEGVDGKEDTANKVTSISSSSTDEQYPSAKAVYDGIQAKTGWELVKVKGADGEIKDAVDTLTSAVTVLSNTFEHQYKELYVHLIIPTMKSDEVTEVPAGRVAVYAGKRYNKTIFMESTPAYADNGVSFPLTFKIEMYGKYCRVQRYFKSNTTDTYYAGTAVATTGYADIGQTYLDMLTLEFMPTTRKFPSGTYYEIWGVKA